MAITYTQIGFDDAGTGASFQILTLDTTPSAGDLIVFCFSSDNESNPGAGAYSVSDDSAGLSTYDIEQSHSDDVSTGDAGGCVATKVAVGDETEITMTVTIDTKGQLLAFSVSGVDTSSPVDGSSENTSDTTSTVTSHAAPSVTPTAQPGVAYYIFLLEEGRRWTSGEISVTAGTVKKAGNGNFRPSVAVVEQTYTDLTAKTSTLSTTDTGCEVYSVTLLLKEPGGGSVTEEAAVSFGVQGGGSNVAEALAHADVSTGISVDIQKEALLVVAAQITEGLSTGSMAESQAASRADLGAAVASGSSAASALVTTSEIAAGISIGDAANAKTDAAADVVSGAAAGSSMQSQSGLSAEVVAGVLVGGSEDGHANADGGLDFAAGLSLDGGADAASLAAIDAAVSLEQLSGGQIDAAGELEGSVTFGLALSSQKTAEAAAYASLVTGAQLQAMASAGVLVDASVLSGSTLGATFVSDISIESAVSVSAGLGGHAQAGAAAQSSLVMTQAVASQIVAEAAALAGFTVGQVQNCVFTASTISGDFVTPDNRLFRVTADVRRFVVSADGRFCLVAAENRKHRAH